MLSVVNRLLIELREDTAVAAIADDRIRANEPQGAYELPDGTKVPGDARGAKEGYVAFAVLVSLGSIPHPSVPTQQVSVGFTAYGRTDKEASDLANAMVDALHAAGPRLHTNGLGIFVSHITSTGVVGKDPITAQPCERGVIELTATTQVVTA